MKSISTRAEMEVGLSEMEQDPNILWLIITFSLDICGHWHISHWLEKRKNVV
jgi:hypothetical protein